VDSAGAPAEIDVALTKKTTVKTTGENPVKKT
jgi:hypothetical protein